MERLVTFRPYQAQLAGDHNNLQAFVRESVDNLVLDAVSGDMAFAGFEVTAATATSVSVAPGRFFSGGERWTRKDATALDLFASLPLVTKKKIAVVTWGVVSELDVQPRDFLINATTRQAAPQAVSMETRRAAQIALVAGIESPDPQMPAVDANLLAVAVIVVTPVGIESIEMLDANRVPNLADHESRVDVVEAFVADAAPRISTIASDLAKLAAAVAGSITDKTLAQLYEDVATLKELMELPDEYTDYGADVFLTADESDTEDLNYLAKVEEGIRFAAANEDVEELAVFSALDPNMTLTNGFLLPKWTAKRRISSLAYSGEVSISSYGFQTISTVQRMMSRKRVRYGKSYAVCTNNAWWKTGSYDAAAGIFRKDGETFEVVSVDDKANNPSSGSKIIRLRQFWIDKYLEPYWDYVVTDEDIVGALIAQTFLNSQDGWLVAAGLYFTRKPASGSVRVLVCETTNGLPNPRKVVAKTTVALADVKLHPTRTPVTLPPTFLSAGKRYALVVMSNADYWAAMAGAGSYTQGTFFYSTDGVYFQGDLTKDLMFDLDFAAFAYPRVVINLNPLNLDGGIADIDVLAECVEPENTELTYEAQIGGTWLPLSALSPGNFAGLPPLVPLRAVFTGTTDIHAGVKLTGSQVKFSRPRTTFLHLSTAREIAAPASNVTVKLRLENYTEANHNCTCTVTPDGAGEETPDTVTDRAVDATTIERTFAFSFAAPNDTYVIKIEGSTSTALDTFHVAKRFDLALS